MEKLTKTTSKIKITLVKAMKDYFEDQKVDLLFELLDDHVSWIGAEVNEYIIGKTNILDKMSIELKTNDAQFKVLNHQLVVELIKDDIYSCHGFAEIGDKTSTSKVDYLSTYVSGVISGTADAFKILHFHVSVPSSTTKESNYWEEKIKSQTLALIDRTDALENIIENIMGGVHFINFDETLTISFVSDGFTRLTGYTLQELDEMHNCSYRALINEDDYSGFSESLKDQVACSNTYSVTYRLRHKDGHTVWVDDRGTLVQKVGCDPYFQCVLMDVSHYIEQQEYLKVSEKRYEAAVKLSGVMMFEYDVLTKSLVFYDETPQNFGLNETMTSGVEQMIEKGIIEIESATEFRELFEKVTRGETTASCIISARDLFGVIHFYELSLVTIFDAQQNPVKAVGVRKNISQLRRLLKEEEFARNLVTEMTLIIEANITLDRVEYLSDLWADYRIDEYLSFKKMIRIIVNSLVHIEDRGPFLAHFELENLNRIHAQSVNVMTFRYRRLVQEKSYHWYEATVNIIEDVATNELHIRLYRKDINAEILIEQRQNDEKQMVDAVLKKVELSYEINVSRNLLLTGSEHWKKTYQIESSDYYDEMVLVFAARVVHPKYQQQFIDTFLCKSILSRFELGVHQISYEYERLSSDGEYRWVLSILNLFKDDITDEIKGFIYVEDIDERKQHELFLLYKAEHDQMTGVYNRATTERLIKEALSFNSYAMHAVLLIDIDLFKNINDTYGHLIGDEVIIATTKTIVKLVRDQDIIGRVGGDEFIVFMANIESEEAAYQRAQKICDVFAKRKPEGLPEITVSVGVSIFPKQGNDFHDLYLNADQALYSSKGKGRNQAN